mgnify:FL=1
MSFNFSFGYNENQSNCSRMMGFNEKALESINESDDIFESYAPDCDYSQGNNENVSIMSFSQFEDDIFGTYDDNEDGGINCNG